MGKLIVKAREYKVADGDSLESIAKGAGLTWQELAIFNFGTDAPAEINKYLNSRLGCKTKAKDGVNYNFTSKDDPGIIYIPEKGEQEFASSASHTIKVKSIILKEYITSRCFIKFRPQDSWKGEFGFDWLREKDTGIVGDVKYKGIIGNYGAVYATESTAVFTPVEANYTGLKNAVYNPFNVPWKFDGKDGRAENRISWVALFPPKSCVGNSKKSEATLKLKINIKEQASDRLRIDYNKEFIELDKEEVTPTGVGNHEMLLKVKCLKSFDKDQEITVVNETKAVDGKAIEAVAGKLIVLKNSKANRYKANVLFVKVWTKINGVESKASSANEKTFLEKYLFQSLTTVHVEELALDLRTDVNFNSNWVVPMNALTKAVKNYGPGNASIHSYLDGIINAAKPEYKKWYKVFLINENGGYVKNGKYQGLNGAAQAIPSKVVVLYNTHNTSTTTHELLHAMGLYHTFDNSGSYTFKIGETENIMDYSHQPSFGSKDRISTWKWHWDKLHSALEKE